MSKTRKIVLILSVILLAASAGAFVPLYQLYKTYSMITQPAPPPKQSPAQPQEKEPKKLLPDRYYTFLLYGVDAGEWTNGSFREVLLLTHTVQ